MKLRITSLLLLAVLAGCSSSPTPSALTGGQISGEFLTGTTFTGDVTMADSTTGDTTSGTTASNDFLIISGAQDNTLVFLLTGTFVTTSDFKSIDLVYSLNGKADAPYRLRGYKPGATNVTYRVSPLVKNIKNGLNVYRFVATKPDGTTVQQEVEVNISGMALKRGYDPTFCLLDICVNPKFRYTEKNGVLKQTIGYTYNNKGQQIARVYKVGDLKSTIEIDKNKGVATQNSDEEMGSSSRSLQRVGEYIVDQSSSVSCGGGNLNQYVFDLNGESTGGKALVAKLPTKITLGAITYQLTELNGISQYGNHDRRFYSKYMVPTPLTTASDLTKQLLSIVVKNGFTPQEFFIEFKEIPGVTVSYATKSTIPERIVNLGSNAKNLLDSAGNIRDLSKTNEILGMYDRTAISLTNDDPNKLKELLPAPVKNPSGYGYYQPQGEIRAVRSQHLPVFTAKPLDNKGNYAIFMTNGYNLMSFAEMCKPVVYVYDQDKSLNTLQVTLKDHGTFTKIIPGFTKDQTRAFTANNKGKISVDKHNFDYLYYSASVPNYERNTDGRIVKGKNIRAFFEQKLTTIGLNAKEKKDFIEYRVPEFKPTQTYFVSFKFNEQLDPYAKLTFERNPQTIFRVFMESKSITNVKLNENVIRPHRATAKDEKLLKKLTRSNVYDVVERGGMLLKEGRIKNVELRIH